MGDSGHRIAFGPVPSRRLGSSLGINHIPTKTCSYSCAYCQVGSTANRCIEPRTFFPPARIHAAVVRQLEVLRERKSDVDFLTFVPDGEPTLDLALGESIEALRGLGIPIAVISNASLMWRKEVRARLRDADLVSIKVDTVAESGWRRINRPGRDLELDRVLRGIREFSAEYRGTLISETMLLGGINDSTGSLRSLARFLAEISPRTAYLAVPTRPTAVPGVTGTGERGLTRAHEFLSTGLADVKLLAEHETGEFAGSGDAQNDLLAVTAVHPMREAAVRQLLSRSGEDWRTVEELLSRKALRCVWHEGERFYLRSVKRS